MNEIWKDVVGYEGLYQVSNLGRVKSVERKVKSNPNVGMRIQYERILAQGDNGSGYKFANLWKDGKGKQLYVHRLVAEAFIDNPNNYPLVDHIDTDRSNNCVDNLRWVTNSMNMANPITKLRSANARKTEEYKQKMHKALSGSKNGANTHPETNNFIINNPHSFKGTHYYNNGTIEIRAKECPEGFTKGRLSGCFGR